jgi:hypothetical protein
MRLESISAARSEMGWQSLRVHHPTPRSRPLQHSRGGSSPEPQSPAPLPGPLRDSPRPLHHRTATRRSPVRRTTPKNAGAGSGALAFPSPLRMLLPRAVCALPVAVPLSTRAYFAAARGRQLCPCLAAPPVRALPHRARRGAPTPARAPPWRSCGPDSLPRLLASWC